ncbi:MAG: hypothetical protein ACOYOT_02145 [Bacteroidales bacterium]
MGAVSGLVTAGIGGAFGHSIGSFSHEVGRAVVHGFAQGMMSEISGGDFIQGFLSGSLGSLGGSAFQKIAGEGASSVWGTVGFSALAGGIGSELSGGDFLKGATTGAIIGLLNHEGGKVNKAIRNGIARIAKRYVGSTEYNATAKKDNFLRGNPKCNKFVADVLDQSGAGVGLPNEPGRSDLLRGATGGRPPTASQWASPDYEIPDWEVVSDNPQPGDIVSYKGHVGIVFSNGLSISATIYSGVVLNDWGFRADQNPTFRRYVGNGLIAIK